MQLKTNCYDCIHRRNIPGNAHSKCANPNINIFGNEHGIRNGWFHYPYNFDPVWRINECDHFEVQVVPSQPTPSINSDRDVTNLVVAGMAGVALGSIVTEFLEDNPPTPDTFVGSGGSFDGGGASDSFEATSSSSDSSSNSDSSSSSSDCGSSSSDY